jgi:predicted amidohydrolase YtcJ
LELGRARRQRLGRADRGARSARRRLRGRPAHARPAASTVNPAWLAGDERRRGKLLPGYRADLVVLDRDPVASPPGELPEVQVVATMLGGAWVHNPPPWD